MAGFRLSARGQTSIELLSYIGIFTLAVSAIYAEFYPAWTTSGRVATAEVTVSEVATVVEEVYSTGPGRRQTITVNIPSDVEYTQVSDNRVVLRLGLPGQKTTDIVEAVEAPLRGNVPRTEGTHRIAIEYMDAGFVLVGGSLGIRPKNTKVNMTADNSTSVIFHVVNNGADAISDVTVSSTAAPEYRIEFNVTDFDLMPGEEKAINCDVKTKADILPITYKSIVKAETPGEYADATLEIDVFGNACGDTIAQEPEECDTRTPFNFPDEDSPFCHNTQTVSCDILNHRYETRDAYGRCGIGCRCEEDAQYYVSCGADCTDPAYCLGCPHCQDGVRNCNEEGIDSGPACQGYSCIPGETKPCGEAGCEGVKSCIKSGTDHIWSTCSTYSNACTGVKCCTCGIDPANPSQNYNASIQMSVASCTGHFLGCGDRIGCIGGRFGYECAGLDSCQPDFDGSTVEAEKNPEYCNGQTCGDSGYTCADQEYPCHGKRTDYSCAHGSCVPAAVEDDSVCWGFQSCDAPQEIILHKMDNGWSPYVDGPSAAFLGPGNYYLWPEPCEKFLGISRFMEGFYITDPGAYAPYRNGSLNFYINSFYQDREHGDRYYSPTWTSCGCHVRIGTDRHNWLEYGFTCPTKDYIKKTVSLSGAPTERNGTVDWDRIQYLEFRLGGILAQCAQYGHCSANYGRVDYVTLKK